jgi:hypothetical protein
VMMSRLLVMMRRFLRHRENLHSARRFGFNHPQAWMDSCLCEIGHGYGAFNSG